MFVFLSRLLYMARPAKRLKAVWVEGVLPRFALQRLHVVAFEPTGLPHTTHR